MSDDELELWHSVAISSQGIQEAVEDRDLEAAIERTDGLIETLGEIADQRQAEIEAGGAS